MQSRESVADFIVFSDYSLSNSSNDFGILPTFYLDFYLGTIVFLSIEDYLIHKPHLLSSKYVLYIEKEDLYDNVFINKKTIQNFQDVITMKNGEVVSLK